ncbi:MAG: hypothetical protein K2I48_09135 [Muribaculaceae bacterium]|nr:hypothetical protein [Muribaculaceae bacterium]
MDYAIYKTINDKFPRVVHRFTQEAYNHRAKRAAKDKLQELWLRVVKFGFSNADYSKDDEFSYDYRISIDTSDRIRFYIAKL